MNPFSIIFLALYSAFEAQNAANIGPQPQASDTSLLNSITDELNPLVESSAILQIREFQLQTEIRQSLYIAWFNGREDLLLQTLAPEKHRGRKILITKNDLIASLPEARRPLRLPTLQRLASDLAYADMAWVNFARDYRRTKYEASDPNSIHLEARVSTLPYRTIRLKIDGKSKRPISALFCGPGDFERLCKYEDFRWTIGANRPRRLKFEDPTRPGWHAELVFKDWKAQQIPTRMLNAASLNKFSLATLEKKSARLSSPKSAIRTTVKDPMIHVPSGVLKMGTDIGFPEERPTHQVQVHEFWIDRCEVTVGDYRQFAENPEGRSFSPDQIIESSAPDDYFSGSRYSAFPMININWFAASAYCQSVGKRLPSEAEWEWAARGPANRLYPWGNDWDPDAAVFRRDWERPQFTSQCASAPKGKSQFGIEDLAGNVSEWVSDWYNPYPSGVLFDNSFGAKCKVVRGGSWMSAPSALTAVARDYALPSFGYETVGFRCAKDE